MGTLELIYDTKGGMIGAIVPASCPFPPIAFNEHFENELQMTLTLIRKADGKCLVLGDRMEFGKRLDNDFVLLTRGSSAVKQTALDEALFVLSKNPKIKV